MSLVLKDVNMPKASSDLLYIFQGGSVHIAGDKGRYKAIELPKKYGRLIDADVFADKLMNDWHTNDEESKKIILDVIFNVVVPILADTPTVIEREDG